MTLLKEELKITNLKDLLELNLTLPSYQRPYSWSVKSTNTLFLDTYNAYEENLDDYRIGSIILHKENGRYNIVDGQQRLTTLSILLYCLGAKTQGLLQEDYNQLSNNVILTNFNILYQRINELPKNKVNGYKKYLLERCSAVQIVTNNEQEAFQFFDSQNSRGKELAPHDLLKSYHLREMENENEYQKIDIINQWENLDQDNLENLFKIYLFPLTQWYKGKNGLGYSANKIDVFKGIKHTNVANFALYHKASNLFVEQFNASGNDELLATSSLNQFQLTQPLIAGKRFFNYTLHYNELLNDIRELLEKDFSNEQMPDKGSGDLYTKQLYEAALLFFADRFGIQNLSKGIIQQLYSWSYSLRLTMHAVYLESINKYARGNHERLNKNLDLFTQISEMNHAEDIKLIVLEQPEIANNNDKKYDNIYRLLNEWNGWR